MTLLLLCSTADRVWAANHPGKGAHQHWVCHCRSSATNQGRRRRSWRCFNYFLSGLLGICHIDFNTWLRLRNWSACWTSCAGNYFIYAVNVKDRHRVATHCILCTLQGLYTELLNRIRYTKNANVVVSIDFRKSKRVSIVINCYTEEKRPPLCCQSYIKTVISHLSAAQSRLPALRVGLHKASVVLNT